MQFFTHVLACTSCDNYICRDCSYKAAIQAACPMCKTQVQEGKPLFRDLDPSIKVVKHYWDH